MFDDGFYKWLFVLTWLNIFVLLEPFANKHGYRTIIFSEDAGWRVRVGFFLAMNAAFLFWAFALTARI